LDDKLKQTDQNLKIDVQDKVLEIKQIYHEAHPT